MTTLEVITAFAETALRMRERGIMTHVYFQAETSLVQIYGWQESAMRPQDRIESFIYLDHPRTLADSYVTNVLNLFEKQF